MKSSGSILEEFEGKTSNDIQFMMSDMKKKEAQFGTLTAKRVPLTIVLERLAELIPEAAWIESVSYTNPVTMGSERRGSFTPRSIGIEGKVIDQSESLEQDVAYRFRDALQENKEFSKAFRDIKMDVKSSVKRDNSETKQIVRDEEQSVKNRLKDATRFKIQCLSRKP